VQLLTLTMANALIQLLKLSFAGGLHGKKIPAECSAGAAGAGDSEGHVTCALLPDRARTARFRNLRSKTSMLLITGRCSPLQVACTAKNFPQNAQRTQPQPELLEDMSHAHFCLVMPGNVQSSGHLADAFFTGCIPVFLGPPFHSLPFPHLVSFQESLLGLFMLCHRP